MNRLYHHALAWLNADTWHWAMLEIGTAVAVILLICVIAAACRGGGSSYSHTQAVAGQRSRADATMRSIGSDYDRLDANMRQAAKDYNSRRN
jgi:hypothetical protein